MSCMRACCSRKNSWFPNSILVVHVRYATNWEYVFPHTYFPSYGNIATLASFPVSTASFFFASWKLAVETGNKVVAIAACIHFHLSSTYSTNP